MWRRSGTIKQQSITTTRRYDGLDKMLETGELNPDILPYMNEFQQQVANEIKKALKRIKRKYAREGA